MTVQREKSLGDDIQSLSRQINRVASRLDQRRGRARLLGLSLGSRIHSGCASPRVLWFAGFAGFLIGDWIHRPANQSRPTIEQALTLTDRPQTAIVTSSNAALLLKFAQDMGRLWANERSRSGV